MSGILFVLFLAVVCAPVYLLLRRGRHRYRMLKAPLIGALFAGSASAIVLFAIHVWWALTVPGGTYLGLPPPLWIIFDNMAFGALFGLLFFLLWRGAALVARTILPPGARHPS